MKLLNARRSNLQWLEWLLMIAVAAGFVRMAYLTVKLGYLPQPFFFDTDDTWRDWFSTAVYAHEGGAYDSWLSIYPPLSFVILKIVGLPRCYEFAFDKPARQCDWVGVGAIHLIYIINIILAARFFLKLDRRTALQRSFSLLVGMPMLFGLERGNLALLCFTFLLLGFGPLVKSARLRWIFVGLAINLKVYLICGVIAQLLRRRWLWLEGVLIATLGIYLITFAIYGAGTPKEIYDNIVNWSSGSTPNNPLDIWYPNTYIPLEYVLSKSTAPINYLLDSRVINFALTAIPIATHSAQAIILLASVAAWLRPEVVPVSRLTYFGLAFAMIASETSTYTQPFLFLFIFMESWKGWARPLAIAVCYILCIPGDIIIGQPAPVFEFSYIAGHYVTAEYGLSVGMLLKPFLLLVPAYSLGMLTIFDVWKDVRGQGWRDRLRFRRDRPLLPGIIAPQA